MERKSREEPSQDNGKISNESKGPSEEQQKLFKKLKRKKKKFLRQLRETKTNTRN